LTAPGASLIEAACRSSTLAPWRAERRRHEGARGACAAQIAAAALGGWIFAILGVPAAWMSGAVVAVVAWGALGFGRSMPRPLVDAAMLISGTTMGAGITPTRLPPWRATPRA
jgi:hypothetical protein